MSAELEWLLAEAREHAAMWRRFALSVRPVFSRRERRRLARVGPPLFPWEGITTELYREAVELIAQGRADCCRWHCVLREAE